MKKSTRFFRSITILLACFMLFTVLTDVSGQTKTVKKVSSDLLSASQPFARRAKQVLAKRDLTIKGPDNSTALIEALSDGNTQQLLSDLTTLGLKNASVYGKKINGFFPVNAIDKLESVKNLVYAEPVYKPFLNAGIAYTNGDRALKSNVTRAKLGLDGRGIKIGVLSDSYNSLQGASQGVVTGELPGAQNPDGYKQEVNVLDDITDGTDEGRAMCEIVHDIVPASTLAFNTAYRGTAAFAKGITNLAEAGCQIITDDIFYYNEPFFQDGIVAQAVEDVVLNKGVAYYSAAGNEDRSSYTSTFRNGGLRTMVNPYDGVVLGRYAMHDFNPGPGVDLFQKIVLAPGDNFTISFQWDEPFASACVDCPGSKSDLDLFVSLSKDTADVMFNSVNYNIDGDPFEFLSLNYSGLDTIAIYVSFGRWLDAPGKNPDPGLVKYVNFGTATIAEYTTDSPTTIGHSNTKHGVSVGASAWFNTPVFGHDPAKINYFSSVGGSPVLFDTKGKRLKKPETRMNPLFTATDGGNTSFFGQQINDGDTLPNFFGTSAAAPHAASVSAQLHQMAAGRVSSKYIDQILCSTALDMDDPYTKGFDKGYDRKTGFGLIQSDKAAEQLLKQVGIRLLCPTADCSEHPNISRNWKITNPNPFTVQVSWELIGSSQRDTLMASPGVNYLTTKTNGKFNFLSIAYDNEWGMKVRNVAFSPGTTCSRLKSTAVETATPDTDEPTIVVGAYPNPFVSTLNVDLYVGQQQPVSIKIYNTMGALVFEQAIEPVTGYSSYTLDLSKLQSGMYMLKLLTADGELDGSYKLLKQ